MTETSRSGALRAGLTIMFAVLVVGLVGAGLLAAPAGDPSPEPSAAPEISAPAPSPSPAPSATLSPTSSPSAPSSASPGPTAAEAIQPGDFATTADTEIPVYDRPDGVPFTTAAARQPVYVIDVLEGWYHVQVRESDHLDYVFGWVPETVSLESGALTSALGRDTPSACMEFEPGSYVWFGGEHPQADFRCHGEGGQLVVRGYAIDATREDPPAYAGEPAWLAGRPELDLSSVIGPAVSGYSVHLHLPPDLVGTVPISDREAHEGTLLEVTGHFDDARSSGCSLTPVADGYPPVSAANAELSCRQRFVVDAVEVVEPED